MTDREKWILGVAGSIATLGLGYLIWRHENAVSQSEAAATTAQNQADEQAYAQELEQSLQVGGGEQQLQAGGYIGSELPTGATTDPTGGTGGDSNLAAILAAFYPQGTGTANGNGGTTGAPNPTPAPPEPTGPGYNPPTADPVLPVAPIYGGGGGFIGGPIDVTATGGPAPYLPPVVDPSGPIASPPVGGGAPVASPARPVPVPVQHLASIGVT